MNVKILRDYDVCFDGIKKTCLKKGQDFDCPDEHLYVLVEAGVVLDPNMDKKAAEKKVIEILEIKEEEALKRQEDLDRKNDPGTELNAVRKELDDLKVVNRKLLAKLDSAEKECADLQKKLQKKPKK